MPGELTPSTNPEINADTEQLDVASKWDDLVNQVEFNDDPDIQSEPNTESEPASHPETIEDKFAISNFMNEYANHPSVHDLATHWDEIIGSIDPQAANPNGIDETSDFYVTPEQSAIIEITHNYQANNPEIAAQLLRDNQQATEKLLAQPAKQQDPDRLNQLKYQNLVLQNLEQALANDPELDNQTYLRDTAERYTNTATTDNDHLYAAQAARELAEHYADDATAAERAIGQQIALDALAEHHRAQSGANQPNTDQPKRTLNPAII